MNWIYTKIMTWIVGEALAHSDRIKTAVLGIVSVAFLQLSAVCSFCHAFLTPDVADKLSASIAALIITLIGSITVRDTLTPFEKVAAGGPALPLPPPPDDALGLPGDPPVVEP